MKINQKPESLVSVIKEAEALISKNRAKALKAYKSAEQKRIKYQTDPVFRENDLARRRAQYKKNPDKQKNTGYLKKYGISLAKRTQMIVDQDYKCDCCNVSFDMSTENYLKNNAPKTDHCHKTRYTRAIICNKCNLKYGNLLAGVSDKALLRYHVKHLKAQFEHFQALRPKDKTNKKEFTDYLSMMTNLIEYTNGMMFKLSEDL